MHHYFPSLKVEQNVIAESIESISFFFWTYFENYTWEFSMFQSKLPLFLVVIYPSHVCDDVCHIWCKWWHFSLSPLHTPPIEGKISLWSSS